MKRNYGNYTIRWYEISDWKENSLFSSSRLFPSQQTRLLVTANNFCEFHHSFIIAQNEISYHVPYPRSSWFIFMYKNNGCCCCWWCQYYNLIEFSQLLLQRFGNFFSHESVKFTKSCSRHILLSIEGRMKTKVKSFVRRSNGIRENFSRFSPHFRSKELNHYHHNRNWFSHFQVCPSQRTKR